MVMTQAERQQLIDNGLDWQLRVLRQRHADRVLAAQMRYGAEVADADADYESAIHALTHGDMTERDDG